MKNWFIKEVPTFGMLPKPSEEEIVYFVTDENKFYAEFEGEYIEVEDPREDE